MVCGLVVRLRSVLLNRGVMGNIHRIRRGMRSKVALSDTGIAVNGCRVLLGHPDEAHAVSTAKGFALMFATALNRSRCVNMNDIYSSMTDIREGLEEGRWN